VVEAQYIIFNFSFSSPDSFLIVDDVEFNANESSFLMNSRGFLLLTGTCGRRLYKARVRMKDPASGAVASFETVFTFSIVALYYGSDATGHFHADGLASLKNSIPNRGMHRSRFSI